MKKSIAWVVATLLTVTGGAWAQDGMINISATGLVDGNPVVKLTACTIISGMATIVVLAEATTDQTDPLLGITWLHDGIEEPIGANDDWVTLTSDEKAIMTSYLRTPNRSTDAAWVAIVGDAAICAHAFEMVENGPEGRINLQINHIDYP